jgi:hypothetical protein
MWMILLGMLAIWGAIQRLPRWALLTPELKSHNVVFLVAGAALVAAGQSVLARRHHQWMPAWTGAAASAILGVNLLVGVSTGTIPCGGPV